MKVANALPLLGKVVFKDARLPDARLRSMAFVFLAAVLDASPSPQPSLRQNSSLVSRKRNEESSSSSLAFYLGEISVLFLEDILRNRNDLLLKAVKGGQNNLKHYVEVFPFKALLALLVKLSQKGGAPIMFQRDVIGKLAKCSFVHRFEASLFFPPPSSLLILLSCSLPELWLSGFGSGNRVEEGGGAFLSFHEHPSFQLLCPILRLIISMLTAAGI